MRGPFMRSLYVLLALVILAAWGLGIGAVFARDVERLPGHDLSVSPSRCVSCHTAPATRAPAMPHVAFPSCGFCHRQGPPDERRNRCGMRNTRHGDKETRERLYLQSPCLLVSLSYLLEALQRSE